MSAKAIPSQKLSIIRHLQVLRAVKVDESDEASVDVVRAAVNATVRNATMGTETREERLSMEASLDQIFTT